MIDPSYSRQRDQEDRSAELARWRRLIIPLAVAFILIGGGFSIVWGFGGTWVAAPPPISASAPVPEKASNELLETAKGLGVTQQQAVDQLQVVQDQLVAQQAETKKLSEQIATIIEKLDALQQSTANVPPHSTQAPPPGQQPKSR